MNENYLVHMEMGELCNNVLLFKAEPCDFKHFVPSE